VYVRSVGNTGHVALYLLLARLWYLHRRGRLDWARLTSLDPRIRPLLIWFLAPVAIWLASPYPNHIRDFMNLVLNRQMGEPTLERGISTYFGVLRTTYFYHPAILAAVAGVVVVATLAYHRQPVLTQALLIAIPLQTAAIALHHTRFTRFLLPTVVLLCLAAASEVRRWLAMSARLRAAAIVLAPAVVIFGLAGARNVVADARFMAVAFEHYTDSEPLRTALRTVREDLNAGDRLAVVGQTNQLSPALVRWELGPPSGVPCFPFEIGGAKRLDLALATRVLLVVSFGAGRSTLTEDRNYLPQRQSVLSRVERGEFILRRELPVPELEVALRLYERTSPPSRRVACR
jgi:hypothetical protein